MTKLTTQTMISEETHFIDGAFTVDQQRWGTFQSYSRKGEKLITSLTEESCIASTRWYLKNLQDGFDDYDVVKHEGQVGGKL